MEKPQNVKNSMTDFQIMLDEAIRDKRMVLLVAVISSPNGEQDKHVRLMSGNIKSASELVSGLEGIGTQLKEMRTDIIKIIS